MNLLLRFVRRVLEKSGDEWSRAAAAEFDHVPVNEQRRWAVSTCIGISHRMLRRHGTYLSAVVGSVALLVWVDRSPDEAANQASLLVLLTTAALTGFLRPRRAWLAALMVGSTVAAARGVSAALGMKSPDPNAPHGWLGISSLLILNLPALAAGYAGACVGRSHRNKHASSHDHVA